MDPRKILPALVLLLCSTAAALLLLATRWGPEPPTPHEGLPTLTVAGSPPTSGLIVAAAAFGGLGVLLGGVLLALGLRSASVRRAWPWIAAAVGVHLGSLLAVLRYGEGRAALAGTAWLLLGLWPAPVLFVVLYWAFFERWFFGAGERRRFEEILARRRERS